MVEKTVCAALEELGLTTIAREMDIPISTLSGWKAGIPGRGQNRLWREQRFWEAVEALRAARSKASTKPAAEQAAT